MAYIVYNRKRSKLSKDFVSKIEDKKQEKNKNEKKNLHKGLLSFLNPSCNKQYI